MFVIFLVALSIFQARFVIEKALLAPLVLFGALGELERERWGNI